MEEQIFNDDITFESFEDQMFFIIGDIVGEIKNDFTQLEHTEDYSGNTVIFNVE